MIVLQIRLKMAKSTVGRSAKENPHEFLLEFLLEFLQNRRSHHGVCHRRWRRTHCAISVKIDSWEWKRPTPLFLNSSRAADVLSGV
jgi:hypothetical protein